MARTRRSPWLRPVATLAVAACAAACAATAAVGPRGEIPAPLRRLVLVPDHPQISPVEFDHARHADPRAMGRDVACADCHHEIAGRADAVPAACGTCHEFAYLRPPVDESAPHDHSLPPDL